MTDKEMLDFLDSYKGSIRLSNKTSGGEYWWAYVYDIGGAVAEMTVQSPNIREAIQKVKEQIDIWNKIV